MPVSSIATSIDNFITLGSGGYANGIVITNTGEVAPTFDAFYTMTGYSFAVNLQTSAATLTNYGTVIGDDRNPYDPFVAGGGVFIAAGAVSNKGTMIGGADESGAGGAGVQINAGSLYNGGLIIGGAGGHLGAGPGLILENGTVANAGTLLGGIGGVIRQQTYGANVSGGGITNTGLIEGIRLSGTGLLINDGLVNGGGVYEGAALSGAATLINNGTIIGDNNRAGVVLSNGGAANDTQTLVNTGTIIGGVTAYAGGGTLTNAGLVAGSSSQDAVNFAVGNTELILDPGALFEGDVIAQESYQSGQETIVNHTYAPVFIYESNVLDLAAGAEAGSIDLGGSFSGFNTIDFAAGSTWILEGDSAELAYQPTIDSATINGFAFGDTIVLDGYDANGPVQYVPGSGGLILDNGTEPVSLDIVGSFVASDFSISTQGDSTLIELHACFAAGTRILTPEGEVAVERLAVGQAVITQAGEAAEILWIGRRQLDLRRHARPAAVQPVRVAASAFADGVPARDLVLSPDHALALQGHLVPVKALVNGMNVARLNRDSVTYYHVELAAHDVIFAELLAVESYLETGNRGSFENGGPAVQLHPEFAQAMRETKSCRPFTQAGPVVSAARKLLCERAFAMAEPAAAAAI